MYLFHVSSQCTKEQYPFVWIRMFPLQEKELTRCKAESPHLRCLSALDVTMGLKACPPAENWLQFSPSQECPPSVTFTLLLSQGTQLLFFTTLKTLWNMICRKLSAEWLSDIGFVSVLGPWDRSLVLSKLDLSCRKQRYQWITILKEFLWRLHKIIHKKQ